MSSTLIPALVALVNVAGFRAGDIIAVDAAAIAALSASLPAQSFARILVPYGTQAVGGSSSTGTTTTVTGGTGGGTGGTTLGAVYLTGVVTQTATTTTLSASDGHTYAIPTSALTAAQLAWVASLPTLQAEADASVAKNTAQDATLSTLASGLTAVRTEADTSAAKDAAQDSSIGSLGSRLGADESSLTTLTVAEAHLASLLTLFVAAPFAYPDGSGALRAGTVIPASVFANGTLNLSGLSNTGTGTGTASPTLAAPSAVTGLSTTSATTTGFVVSWTLPTTGGAVDHLLLSYGVSGGTMTTVNLPATATSYAVSGLVSNTSATNYVYSVTAVNATSTAPANGSATTLAASTASAPPPMPALGTAPSAAGTPPTIYQVVTAQCTGPTSLTATLAALTAGSNVAVLVNGGSGRQNAVAATIAPAGLARVVDTVFGNGWVAAYWAASSSITGGTVTLSGIADTVNMLVIETNAQSLDVTYGALGGAGSTTRTFGPTAADTASATTIVLAKTNENGQMTVSGPAAIGSFPGGTGAPNYNAAVAFQLPNKSTAPVSMTVANANQSSSSSSCALVANLYASTLAGGAATAATPVILPGLPVVPALLPIPAAGLRADVARERAAIAQGKAVRYQQGWFGASGRPGSTRAAKAAQAAGFACRRLEFQNYDNWNDLIGGVKQNALDNYQQGFRGKLLTTSIMIIVYQANYADAAAGAYDANWKQIGQGLIDAGLHDVDVRPGWELEDDYYEPNIDTMRDQFVAAQKRFKFILNSLPGAQFNFVGEAELITGGSLSVGDATPYHQGPSWYGRFGVDGYETAYEGGQGKYLTSNQAQINSINGAFYNASTNSLDASSALATSYGVALDLPEGACVGLRNDGYGIGDEPAFATKWVQYLPAHNVSGVNWWNDNGGGTVSNVTPQTKLPGSSAFPLTWAILKAAFGTPAADPDVANGAIPQTPGMVLSSSGGNLTIASSKTNSADTVVHTFREVCLAGTNNWLTINDVSADTTMSTGSVPSEVDSLPALPTAPTTGDFIVKVRTADANTLGISPWVQQTWDLTSNAAVGSQITYPSTFGLNDDGSYGPSLRAGEIAPTGVVGSGTPMLATMVQDGFGTIAAGAAANLAFGSAVKAGSGIVVVAFGSHNDVGLLTAPAGFVKRKDRVLGDFNPNQWGAVFDGLGSALTDGKTITLGGTGTEDFSLYIHESTGTWYEYVAQPGAYGPSAASVAVPMTATQGNADRFVCVTCDYAGAPTGVSTGTVAHSGPGTNYGGTLYHGPAVVALPPASAGTLMLTYASTALAPGYVAVNLYTANPGGNAVQVGSGATSSSTGTTSTTGTSTAASMVQMVSATTTAAGNATLTLSAAAKAGNHALLLVGNYGVSNGATEVVTVPSGWAQLQASDPGGGEVSIFSAPVSALISNGVTIGIPGAGGAYLVETTAAVFPDVSAGTVSVNGQTLTLQPVAASKTGGDRYAIAVGYDGQFTYPWSGAGVLSSTDSNNGSPYTVLIAVPAASTGTVSATTGTSQGAVYNGSFASVNGYTS